MIAEGSARDLGGADAFRCLYCGSIVVGIVEGHALDRPAANRERGGAAIPSPPVSLMDQFVIRQNIAIYQRRLAMETDPAQREVLQRLLDGERAKQGPAAGGGPTTD
jgi:hypothetical protein